jgi:hypothetical protein
MRKGIMWCINGMLLLSNMKCVIWKKGCNMWKMVMKCINVMLCVICYKKKGNEMCKYYVIVV